TIRFKKGENTRKQRMARPPIKAMRINVSHKPAGPRRATSEFDCGSGVISLSYLQGKLGDGRMNVRIAGTIRPNRRDPFAPRSIRLIGIGGANSSYLRSINDSP